MEPHSHLFLHGHADVTGVGHSGGVMDGSGERTGWALRDVLRLHRERRHRDPALGGATDRDHRWAIVLAAGAGERLLRLVERLTGASLPKQFCAFSDDDETLLQSTLRRLAAHAPPSRIHVVIDRRQRSRAIAQLRPFHGVDIFGQPGDCGTAVGTLVSLIDILVEDPDAVVVISPSDHVMLDEAGFEDALARAFDVAEERRAIVVIGAEPDGIAGDDGWLLPYAPLRPDLRCAVQPVARYVHPGAADDTTSLVDGGAVHSTGLVVASGAALLELFEALTPRLLRLFLYGAAMPPAEGSAFLDLAYDGLGALDLARDLLTLASDLRMVVMPRRTGWSDLGTETRLLAWLAKRRASQRMPQRPRALPVTWLPPRRRAMTFAGRAQPVVSRPIVVGFGSQGALTPA